MVVDDHVSKNVCILSSIFPYDSFFMPMLVFISGYFFRERSVWG
jgi:fucose 4-O-acetylase-like acetyltransferase